MWYPNRNCIGTHGLERAKSEPADYEKNSEISSRVRSQDRKYLDQTALHSSLEQGDFNQQLASLNKTKHSLIVQKVRNRLKRDRLKAKTKP